MEDVKCWTQEQKLINLSPEDEQRPTDDDERRHQHFNDQTARDDAVSHVTRWLSDHFPVHGLHPQTITGHDTMKKQQRNILARITSRFLNISFISKSHLILRYDYKDRTFIKLVWTKMNWTSLI